MTREPGRSRILVIAGVILAAAQCATYVWALSLPPGSPWSLVGVFGLLVPFTVAVVSGVAGLGKMFVTPLSRPARFEVREGSFRQDPAISPGWATLGQLSFYGMLLGQLVALWGESTTDPDPFGAKVLRGMFIVFAMVMALWTALIVAMIVTTWSGGPSYELTPAGVHSRTVLASFFIPWEALYAGGPPRPAGGLTASPVRLAVARPELVRLKGLFRAGSRKQPMLAAVSKAHPWLLPDAIRWYVEHPEHRAAIGTQEEYDRLISTVTADYPRLDVTRRPRPRLVTITVWVAVAGALACVLVAAANLYITVALEDRIAAAKLVAADGEEPFSLGLFLPTAWLVLTVLGAVLTLAAAFGAWRGNPGARAGLLTLSVLLVLSAIVGSCFGVPDLALLGVPGQEMVGIVVIAFWMSLQLFAFSVGTAVFFLLQLPAASDYFKPRFLPDPAVVKV